MQITRHTGHDAPYEGLLNGLMQAVFGFSFAPFFALAGWPKGYESYALIDAGEMLSNVSVYGMTLRIGGEDIKAWQIGAVATVPGRRGEGLSAKLMRHVLARFEGQPLFLFANDWVMDFYPKFGFSRVRESGLVVEHAVDGSGTVQKVAHDDPLVLRLLRKSACLSSRFDVVGAEPVRLFNLMADFREDIYASPEHGLLIVARQEGDTLLLSGVAAFVPCGLWDVIRLLPFSGVKRIRFGFCPDWLGVPLEDACFEETDNILFTNRPQLFPDRFTFPALCMT